MLAALRMGETLIADDCTGDGMAIYSADTGSGPWNYSRHPRVRFARGSIVVGARGSIGSPRLPPEQEFAATQTTIVVTPDRARAVPEFLLHALARLDFTKVTAQQAIPMLTVRDLRAVQLWIPADLGEQARIAEVLDTLDDAIRSIESLLAKLGKLKKGLLHDLLAQDVGDSPIGATKAGAQRSRRTRSLGDVAYVTKLAGFEYTNFVKYRADGEVIAIRPMNIKGGRIDVSEVQRISRSVSDRLPRSRCSAGDVVVTYVGAYVGESALIEEDQRFHLAPNIARVSADRTQITPGFLLLALQSESCQSQIRTLTSTTAAPSLSMRALRSVVVPVPPLTHQHTCVRAAQAMQARIVAAESAVAKLHHLKAGLGEDLLVGHVRVKVDAGDPA